MPDVICSVNSCCHNKTGICYSTSLCISGIGNDHSISASCGSYLNAEAYSNIANLVSDSSPARYVSCSAVNCKHNYNGNCQNDVINVITNTTINYATDAQCQSFSPR